MLVPTMNIADKRLILVGVWSRIIRKLLGTNHIKVQLKLSILTKGEFLEVHKHKYTLLVET